MASVGYRPSGIWPSGRLCRPALLQDRASAQGWTLQSPCRAALTPPGCPRWQRSRCRMGPEDLASSRWWRPCTRSAPAPSSGWPPPPLPRPPAPAPGLSQRPPRSHSRTCPRDSPPVERSAQPHSGGGDTAGNWVGPGVGGSHALKPGKGPVQCAARHIWNHIPAPPVPTVWLHLSYWTSLSLILLICKMGIT